MAWQPPPGYPKQQFYPQQNHYQAPPAQPGHNQTIIIQPRPVVVQHVIQQPSTAQRTAGFIGGMIGSAVRTGSQVVGGVVRETAREIDRHAASPLLDCFHAGSVVRLRNKCSGGFLRVQQNGVIDTFGSLGEFDESSKFVIRSKYENKVVLGNCANPAFHLTITNGMAIATGLGDNTCSFRLHETFDNYVTFQHNMTGSFFGIGKDGQIMPPSYLHNSRDECKFEVHLVYSMSGHRYIPYH